MEHADQRPRRGGGEGVVAQRWLVDGTNVVGSRPDGWWRDRPAAFRRLVEALGPLAANGDEVTVVFDGRPAPGLEAGAKGVVEDLKGKAKDAIGNLTGNQDLEREGEAQQAKADAEREVAAKEAEAEKARAEAQAQEAQQRANQQ